MREAMDEQCFQESLHIVEGVTHTRQTIATKTLDYTPISPLLYCTKLSSHRTLTRLEIVVFVMTALLQCDPGPQNQS